jgi:hypothetical protein
MPLRRESKAIRVIFHRAGSQIYLVNAERPAGELAQRLAGLLHIISVSPVCFFALPLPGSRGPFSGASGETLPLLPCGYFWRPPEA